jgi:hypothetical protein
VIGERLLAEKKPEIGNIPINVVTKLAKLSEGLPSSYKHSGSVLSLYTVKPSRPLKMRKPTASSSLISLYATSRRRKTHNRDFWLISHGTAGSYSDHKVKPLMFLPGGISFYSVPFTEKRNLEHQAYDKSPVGQVTYVRHIKAIRHQSQGQFPVMLWYPATCLDT